MATEIGIRKSEFKDNQVPPTLVKDPATGKEKKVYSTFSAFVAVIRSGKSELCVLTPKRLEQLRELGVPEPVIAECERQMADADKRTQAANPGRSFAATAPAREASEGSVSIASIMAAKARK